MDNFDWANDSVSKKDVHVTVEAPEGDVNDRLSIATSLARDLIDLTRESDNYGLDDGLIDELRGPLMPHVLLVWATEDDCKAVVEKLTKAVGEVIYRRRTRFLNAWKEDNVKFAKLKSLKESLPDAKSAQEMDEGPLKAGLMSFMPLYCAAWKSQEDFHDSKVNSYREFCLRTQVLFQERINELLDQASNEAQLYCPFSQHLNKKGTARDALDKARDALKAHDTSQTRDTLEGTRDIPWMIAKAILSEADLESCAQLRQVNRFWYSFFNESEALLESKVRRRSPWMSPSGELKTWADCALVFAMRVGSKKWTETDLAVFPRGDFFSPVRRFHVRELQWGLALPDDFRGLDARKNGCVDFSENRELLEVQGCEELFDLKEGRPVKAMKCKIDRYRDATSLNEDDMVIMYKNLEIILPWKEVMDPEFVTDIAINKHTVVVTCMNDATRDPFFMVFPIDKLHYNDATMLEAYGRVYEIGTVVVHQTDEEECVLYYYDMDTQKYESYGEYESVPVASYNGLIWWKEGESDYADDTLPVAPTFVDMDQEEESREFFRKDKTIYMDTYGERSCVALKFSEFNQCSREPQFIFANQGSGMILLDLSGGTVTDLINIYKAGDGCDSDGRGTFVFPGFVGNIFHVRCYPPATVFHCAKKMQNWVEGAGFELLPQAEKHFDNDDLEDWAAGIGNPVAVVGLASTL
ncbi:hypothetical protein CJU90_3660 [Yarrowia sp. C11]|nr:hypothetical protein CKK34_5270 [Yarrowia sp. E02]KAG5367372.1 hypothetical protein CJU90_3660 [Yarrowia sp. C11]